MKKIVSIALILFFISVLVGRFNQVEASSSVSYSVTGVFDTGGSWAGLSGTLNRGDTMSFDLSSKPSGHDFAFWIVNGVVNKNLAQGHTFNMTSSMQLQVVFTPTGKYAAVFIDSNGEYIGVVYTEGGTVSDAALSMPAARPGFQITSGKWTSIEGSASIGNVTENSVFVLTYEESGTPLGDVTLSVTGGSASVANPVDYNTLVTVTADEPGVGEVFAGWQEGSTIVSYDETYTFTALYNRTLTAQYAGSVTPTALVTMSNALENRTGYYTYVGQFELLAGQSMIEYGFIMHPTSDTENITFSTDGIEVAQSNNRQANTNEFVTTFLNDSHASIRAYLIYEEDDTVYTIYSSNNVTYAQAEQLATPSNLSINASTEVLTWDAVANVSSYTVLVGEQEFTGIATESFNLGSQTMDGNKNYEVAVVAVGDGESYTDSAMSSVSTYQRIRFTGLIISEYIEGSSSNKYIEIFNGTGSTIDLSNFQLLLFSNGSATATTTNTLEGSILHNTTVVYKNSAAALTLPQGVTASDASAVNYNGDDAFALYNSTTAQYHDIFGVIDQDPGSAWTSGSLTTVNKTLVRKSTVYVGITTNPTFESQTGNDFATLGTEWDMYDQDTATYLGSHTVTFSTTVSIPEE